MIHAWGPLYGALPSTLHPRFRLPRTAAGATLVPISTNTIVLWAMNYGEKHSSCLCRFPRLQGSRLPLRTDLVKVRVCWSLTAALGKPCVFKSGFGEGREAAARGVVKDWFNITCLSSPFRGLFFKNSARIFYSSVLMTDLL